MTMVKRDSISQKQIDEAKKIPGRSDEGPKDPDSDAVQQAEAPPMLGPVRSRK